MKTACNSNAFTINESAKSILYQLRIRKQNTTNTTLFQANFSKKIQHLVT